MAERELIHLVADISRRHTLAKWRYPGSWNGYNPYGSTDPYLVNPSPLAPRRSDGAVSADFLRPAEFKDTTDDIAACGMAWPLPDPLPMAIATAGVTQHLSFVTTLSIPCQHPFHVARLNDKKVPIKADATRWLAPDVGSNAAPKKVANTFKTAYGPGGLMIAPWADVPGGFSRFVQDGPAVLQDQDLMRTSSSLPPPHVSLRV